MIFTTPRIAEEWATGPLVPPLREIVEWGAAWSKEHNDWTWELSSIYRTPMEDAKLSGTRLHCSWRCVDVRVQTRSWDDPAAKAVADVINKRWSYDPERSQMVVALFKTHGSATGPHIHLQVHPRTLLREAA